jgi:molybdopterin synthase sulfur carrier subunit
LLSLKIGNHTFNFQLNVWTERVETKKLTMKKYKIKAFGITKDILGGKETVVDADVATVGDLRIFLNQKYPQLKGLNSLYIAVNHSYAEEASMLVETDEIALIPPVSGG